MAAEQKRKIKRAISLFLVVLYFCGLPAHAQYGGGSGTADDPYLIHTAEQMNSIGLHEEDWNKHFKLMDDIDLAGFTGTDFNIIGYYVSWYDKEPFTGVLDGNGKKISNFSYTSADANGIGLFGYIRGENVQIKDLGLINPNVNAGTGNYVGSLVGYLAVVNITNCYVEGGSVSGNSGVGGLVGYNYGTITDCYSTGSVSGETNVGGLVGQSIVSMTDCYVKGSSVSAAGNVGGLVGYNKGIINNCSATGSVSGTGNGVGGLVGNNSQNGGTITKCYSTVEITGEWYVGVLVGWNEGTVRNCYSIGSVTGNGAVGGLVGWNEYGTISNCYSAGRVSGDRWIGGLAGDNYGTITGCFWDIQTSGQSTSAGGTGKATTEMQMESTFNGAGWDFTTPIWTIDEGVDYPRLWWERQEPFKYGGGNGTAEEPYLIHTAEQLNTIGANSNDWDKHFKLMADIDLSAFKGTDFNLIGYYKSIDDNKPFTGVFDGNGHTISNFSYRIGPMIITEGIGLFRYVGGTDMEIKDLGLIDPNVVAVGKRGVGSLVGLMEYGAITNCYVQNGYISGNTWVGGLLGRIYVCLITDCYVEADVSGFTKIGGLVGENYAGVIKNCSSASDVFGTSKIGGLVGVNEFLMEQGLFIPGNITGCCAEGTSEGLNCVGGLVGDNLARVTDSYATADVFVVEGIFVLDGPTGNRIGGLVGHNYYSTDALVPPSVLRCYSIGSIAESIFGSDNVGGLVGLNEGTVTNSFWDVETSGLSSSDGGTGRTTSQMQRQSTFINAGWDFIDETANGTEDVWWILEGQDYPRLSWELIEEEPDEVADSLSEAMDTHLSFTTGGNADWFAQTTTYHYDGDAAQSGDISHSQESWMQTTVSGTGMIKFYWKVSSEEDFDFLEFYIDGSLQDRISGLVNWEQKAYTISTSGSHTLEWRYIKDESGGSGSDCGWVDKVDWIPAP